jgi:hypothetical protein
MDNWVRFNALTHCYETKDGTSVPAELCDSVVCLADIFYIAKLRANQRAAMLRAREESNT